MTTGNIGDVHSGAASLGPIPEQQERWEKPDRTVHECEVWLVKEGGLVSAIAANLPGVVAQGQDIDDAVTEIQVALNAAVASYKDRSLTIPWKVDPEPDSELVIAERRWVVVSG